MTPSIRGSNRLVLAAALALCGCYAAGSTPAYVQGGRYACSDTCQYAHDGDCDDGRQGAVTSTCTYGTDCSDCGGQSAAQPVYVSPAQPSGAGMCANTCRHANDGDCDDGRPGSATALCPYGTDCNDCGNGP